MGIALGAVGVLLAQRVLNDGPIPVQQPIRTPAPAPQSIEPPAPTSPRAVSLAQVQGMSYGFERTAALHDLLRSVDAGGIEALLEEAAAHELVWTKWAIYSRYVDLAPRAALNYLVSNRPVEEAQVNTALFAWALKDLDAALAFGETLDQPLRTNAGRNLLYTLGDLTDARRSEIARRMSVETELTKIRVIADAASDPASAWQSALAMEAGESRTQALWAVAWRWFDKSPVEALSALNSVADDDQRATWQRRLLERWVEIDREAALQWPLSQAVSSTRTWLLAEVATIAAKDSPVEVLAFAARLDPKERRDIATRALAVWARSDPSAALAALEQMADPRLTQMVQRTLVNQWARMDALAVFEWARIRDASDNRTQALATSLGEVARSEPEKAMALAADLDGVARSRVIARVLSRWADDDPRAAAAWLDAAPDRTPDAVAAVARGYAALDAEEAFDWLLGQPLEAQRRSAQTVVSRVAMESPEAALRLIGRIDDPTTATAAASVLVSRWTRDDPRAAVRAIARMGDHSRLEMYRHAFSAWSSIDPEAATVFIGQVPVSGRDEATNGVLQQVLFAGDVQFAEQLFDRLVDKEARRNAATTMFFQLSRTDPKRAERYREIADIATAEDGSVTITIPGQDL